MTRFKYASSLVLSAAVGAVIILSVTKSTNVITTKSVIIDTNAPTLQQQLIPVTDKWKGIYDVNDLEVVQTYNIAAIKAVLIDVRNRVAALEKYTYEPNNP